MDVYIPLGMCVKRRETVEDLMQKFRRVTRARVHIERKRDNDMEMRW